MPAWQPKTYSLSNRTTMARPEVVLFSIKKKKKNNNNANIQITSQDDCFLSFQLLRETIRHDNYHPFRYDLA